MSDLMAARPVINSMCNFFNATLYAAYRDCPQELSKNKTFELVALSDTIVSGAKIWNGTHGKPYGQGAGNGTCSTGWNHNNRTGMHWNETKTGIWWKS